MKMLTTSDEIRIRRTIKGMRVSLKIIKIKLRLYRECLNSIAADSRNTRGKRLATATIRFADSLNTKQERNLK